MNDDAQLIDEALAGRSVAFGRLVTKYQDRLYNALVHVVGRPKRPATWCKKRLCRLREAGFVPARRRFTLGSTGLRSTWRSAGIERHGRRCRSTSARVERPGNPARDPPPTERSSGKNGPPKCKRRWRRWTRIIGPCSCCGKSTAAAMKRSRKSSICRSAPSAADCIGLGWNCENC